MEDRADGELTQTLIPTCARWALGCLAREPWKMVPDPKFHPEASNKDGQGQEVDLGQGLGLIPLWKGSLASLKQTQGEECGEEPGEWGGLRLENRPLPPKPCSSPSVFYEK